MKVAVLADTHIPKAATDLPRQVYNELQNSDMILLAGDIVELWVIDKLKVFADVKAVRGNMDSTEVCGSLPEKEIIKIGKFKIGMIHGQGAHSELVNFVENSFKNDSVDVIIFGHSHEAMNIHKNGILFFNPGSPTDKKFCTENSYGILEINDSIAGTIKKIGAV